MITTQQAILLFYFGFFIGYREPKNKSVDFVFKVSFIITLVFIWIDM